MPLDIIILISIILALKSTKFNENAVSQGPHVTSVPSKLMVNYVHSYKMVYSC